MNKLLGFSIDSKNGEEIGKVKDFYFDSQELIVRYIIVDTGSWLISRKVLISPEAFEQVDWEESSILTNLSKKEIEESPPIEKEQPVSRQMEMKLAEHFDWMSYWAAGTPSTVSAYPSVRAAPLNLEMALSSEEKLDE
ncbi:MAG: PRC-barrel domain-containing protein, partial [Halanaerobiales bacterium]